MPWTLEKHGMSKDDYNVELHDGKSFIDLNDPKVLAKIVKCVNMHDRLIDIVRGIATQPDKVEASFGKNFLKEVLLIVKEEAE